MRGLLTRVGLRGVAAAGLLLLVLAVVAIARLGRDGGPPPRFPSQTQPPPTVDPTVGDDGAVAASRGPYPDEAGVLLAAKAFAAAWLRHDLGAARWHAGVARLATPSLGASLDGVDPRGVPATRAVGEPALVLRTERYAQVMVPVDTGTVRLNLRKDGDRWLVDGVDWERA